MALKIEGILGDMVEIKCRLMRKVLYEGPEFSVKDLLERLVKESKSFYEKNLRGSLLGGVDLRYVDLRGADLREAYLVGGVDLRYADLQGADLRGADLRGADLRGSLLGGAHLQGANLRYADFYGANLQGADLREVDLERAHLLGAGLQRADLREAYLRGSLLGGANLQNADLGGTDLQEADLGGANLQGADLRGSLLVGADLFKSDLRGSLLGGTILDPENKPNGEGLSKFERTKNGRCIGYRTRKSTHVGSRVYKDRGTYTAPVFSTCEETECHPGLYLWPTLDEAKDWATRLSSAPPEIIKVTFSPEDLHGVKGKYRVKRFTVVGVESYNS